MYSKPFSENKFLKENGSAGVIPKFSTKSFTSSGELSTSPSTP